MIIAVKVVAIFSQPDISLAYEKGQVIKSTEANDNYFTTNKNGQIKINNLYLGKYQVTEVETGESYISDPTPKNATLNLSHTSVTVSVDNTLKSVELTLNKVKEGTQLPIPGATFKIYAAEDLVLSNTTIAKDTAVTGDLVTDADGKTGKNDPAGVSVKTIADGWLECLHFCEIAVICP